MFGIFRRRCSSISYFRIFVEGTIQPDRREICPNSVPWLSEESFFVFLGIANLTGYIKPGKAKKIWWSGTAIRFLAIYLKPFQVPCSSDQGGSGQTLHLSGQRFLRLKRVNFPKLLTTRLVCKNCCRFTGMGEIQYPKWVWSCSCKGVRSGSVRERQNPRAMVTVVPRS